MLLVEAALGSDKIVAARDENSYNVIQRNIKKYRGGEFREICWVNPCEDIEKTIKWLKEGAILPGKD